MTSPHAQPAPAPSQRFVAKRGWKRRHGAVMLFGALFLLGGMSLVGRFVPQPLATVLSSLLSLFPIAYLAVFFLRSYSRGVTLDVDAERVLVDGGRGGVHPIAGATLGVWRMAGIGVTYGAALCLREGERVYRIGGMGHRLPPALPVAAPVEDVDAYVTQPEFEQLLRFVPGAEYPAPAAYRGAPEASGLVRCELAANPWSMGSGFKTMLPWLGTMGIVLLVSALFEATGLSEARGGQYVEMGIVLSLVLGGLVLTFVRGARKPPLLALELDARELRLRNPESAAVLAAFPRRSITVTRGTCTAKMGRGGDISYPVLVFELPGREPLAVGAFDTRFSWSDSTREVPAPRHVVGAPDWYALLDALGERDRLLVRGA